MKLKALSIMQPWPYAIFYLGKIIENRGRHTNIRGTIAIHASKKVDIYGYNMLIEKGYCLPPIEQLPVGKILGTVEIIDSVDWHPSEWKEPGTIGYVLQNPATLLQPFDAKGQLGFWDCQIPEDFLCKHPF